MLTTLCVMLFLFRVICVPRGAEDPRARRVRSVSVINLSELSDIC